MQRIQAYKQTEVNTADSVRVVSLLFDGAVNFLRMSREKLKNGDIAGKGLFIGKTTAIVGELASSLNMEAGGEVARNLERLYDYVQDRLVQANLKNDLKAYEDAERVLDTLRGAWKEMEQNRTEEAIKTSAAPMPSQSNTTSLGLTA